MPRKKTDNKVQKGWWTVTLDGLGKVTELNNYRGEFPVGPKPVPPRAFMYFDGAKWLLEEPGKKEMDDSEKYPE